MTLRFLVATAAVLALAACQPAATNTGYNINTAEPPPTNAVSAANTAAPPETPAAVANALNPEGYGPLHVGMTWEEAHTAMPSLTRQVEEQMEACYTASTPELPNVYIMFEDRKLARVSAREGASVTAAEGLRVGQPAAEVERVYGARATSEPHHYEAAPARYLTVWAIPGQRGVRFEIGENGNIEAIHAGGPQIEYVEGCA